MNIQTAALSYMKEFLPKSCEYKPKLNNSREHILWVEWKSQSQLGKAQTPKMASAKYRDCGVSVHKRGMKTGPGREHNMRQLTHLKGREISEWSSVFSPYQREDRELPNLLVNTLREVSSATVSSVWQRKMGQQLIMLT